MIKLARKTNYSKNGKEYYRVTATFGRDSDGKPNRKEFYGKSKKEAEDKRDEYKNGIKSGLDLDYKNVYMGELMHSWLFEIVRINVKVTSFARYEGIYRNHIKNSEIYGLKISELQSIQLQRYYNKLFDSGSSSASISSINKFLKSFFNYAVDEGYLIKNPCSGKRIVIPGLKGIKETEIEVFTNEEISLLKKVLDGNRLKCLILMALGTGLREGELLALKWSDLSPEYTDVTVNKTIKRIKKFEADGTSKNIIIVQPPKSQTSNRVVPIPSTLVPVIKNHELQQKIEKVKVGPSYIDEGFVFATETGGSLDPRNLFQSYKRLLIKAQISHHKFHSLRHTYATKLFERGVPLKTVSMLLGHSNVSITANIYTHVMPKEKITAVETLNDLFK